jgi:hypothetical protein
VHRRCPRGPQRTLLPGCPLLCKRHAKHPLFVFNGLREKSLKMRNSLHINFPKIFPFRGIRLAQKGDLQTRNENKDDAGLTHDRLVYAGS